MVCGYILTRQMLTGQLLTIQLLTYAYCHSYDIYVYFQIFHAQVTLFTKTYLWAFVQWAYVCESTTIHALQHRKL